MPIETEHNTEVKQALLENDNGSGNTSKNLIEESPTTSSPKKVITYERFINEANTFHINFIYYCWNSDFPNCLRNDNVIMTDDASPG